MSSSSDACPLPPGRGLVVLTWQEHIGSTIVHVLDFTAGTSYLCITPADGGFLRMTGEIEVKA
jgi:hypothetical protein